MKKIFSFIGAIAAAAICFSACQKEASNTEKSGQTHTVVFTAESPKTVLGDGNAEWLESDKTDFHVFEDGAAAKTISVELNGGKAVVTATFDGSAAGSHTYTGFVASSLSSKGNPKVLTEQTPDTATPSYDPKADILFAKPITGENLTSAMFQYKRVVAINKMTLQGVLDGETVSKVTIAGDKSIAGSYNKETAEYSANDKIIVVNTGATTVYFISGAAEDATLTVTVNTDKAVYTKTFAKTIDLVEGSLHGFTVVYGPEHRKEISTAVYNLVTSIADLADGDLILLGDATAQKASGTKSGDYLSAVDAEIAEGKLTPLGTIEQITLQKDGDNWKLNTANGAIGATAVKKLAYDKGTLTWTISIGEGGAATIASTESTNGRFLCNHNNGNPRFLNYTSATSATMRLVTIYKLDDGKTPLDAPVITLNVDEASKTVTISWGAVANANGYTVKCTGKTDISTTATTAQFTGLETDVDYTVTVVAEGGEAYRPSSASKTFKIASGIDSIDKLFAAATKAGGTATDVTVKFGGWVVSGVKGTNNAYVTDGTKGFIIFQNNHGFAKGDILSGTVDCKVQLYNGSAEITTLTSSTEGLVVAKGGTVSPQDVSISDLGGINTGAYISIKNVIYNGTVFSDGTNTIKPYNAFITLPTLKNGTKYNIKGVYIQYNSTKEIAPLSAEDFEEIAATKYAITIADGIQHGTVTTDPENEAIEGAVVTLTVTPDKGYALKSVSVKKTASGTPVTVTSGKFTMPAEAVTVSAEFEEGQTDYSTVYTSNVTFVGGAQGYLEKVVIGGDQYDCLRIASSSKAGSGTFTVPAGTTKLYIHLAGWNGNTTAPSFSTSVGSISGVPDSVISDSGIANTSPYTLAGTASGYYYELTMSGVTSEATVTVSAASKKRVVLFGVNAVK